MISFSTTKTFLIGKIFTKLNILSIAIKRKKSNKNETRNNTQGF